MSRQYPLPQLGYRFLILTLLCFGITESSFGQSVAEPTEPLKSPVVEAIQAREVAIEELMSDYAETEVRMQALYEERQAILSSQDATGISQESFGEVLSILQTQRVQLMIDIAGLEAKRDVIDRMEDQASSNRSQKSQRELVKKLLAEVQKQESYLGELKSLGDQVSTSEIRNAEQKLLTITIRLAEAESELDQANPMIQGHALSMALEHAEKVARLDKVSELLANLVSSREKVSQISLVEKELDDFATKRQRIADRLEQEKVSLERATQQMQLMEQMQGARRKRDK